MAGSNPSDDQAATIAFLSRPDSYGITGPVERIDTHAAIVFLAGERAYKLKRAVRYSFLDFSTLARRRAVCEAELTLNRRTAPELYLELRSVNRQADGTVGFGAGEVLDWVIVMQRFGGGDLLEAVAARGDLHAGLVRELADAIAAFHDRAEVVACTDGGGRVRRVIDGNAATMAGLPDDSLPGQDCEDLHDRSSALWQQLAPLLDARGTGGHVRHCHGDLHLANICLWRGRPVPFDCLEFDVELATIDVLYDLAFLVMDLCERGYRGQASLLFNRYLDMRDEAAGIAALPLFLSMRAAIRAHVGATAAGMQASEAGRREKLAAAREYLAAARAFLAPEPARLVAIGGFSGTGKSTLAAALAPEIGPAPGARWLRTDVLRKRMAGVAPEMRLPSASYSREHGTAVYRRLAGQARAMLAAGRSVVVDGVFADPQERQEIAAVAAEAGVRFDGLWLQAPAEALLIRVRGRTGDASDADESVVARQLRYDPGPLAGWHAVDAAGTPEAVLARSLDLVDASSGQRHFGPATPAGRD